MSNLNTAPTSTRRLQRVDGEVHHGECFLPSFPLFAIDLEGGKTVRLPIAAELDIPTDPEERERAATTAHSRLAFWDYQMERALAAVRRQETRLDEVEGMSQLIWRKWHEENMATTATNDEARGHVALERDVQTARNTLTDLRERYGILRCVRDALVHRAHLLRKLVASAADARE